MFTIIKKRGRGMAGRGRKDRGKREKEEFVLFPFFVDLLKFLFT